MESHLGFVSTVFFASMFLLLSSPSLTNASTRLVESVCNEVVHDMKGNFAECVKAIEWNPQSQSASSYGMLAPLVLDSAIAKAKDNEAFILGLLKKNPGEAIKLCADSYKNIVRDFAGAKQELKEDPLSANYDIKTVVDEIQQCETAWSSEGLQVPEIGSRNHVALVYSNIGFIITNHM